jgi:hypothetical protein
MAAESPLSGHDSISRASLPSRLQKWSKLEDVVWDCIIKCTCCNLCLHLPSVHDIGHPEHCFWSAGYARPRSRSRSGAVLTTVMSPGKRPRAYPKINRSLSVGFIIKYVSSHIPGKPFILAIRGSTFKKKWSKAPMPVISSSIFSFSMKPDHEPGWDIALRECYRKDSPFHLRRAFSKFSLQFLHNASRLCKKPSWH